MCTCTSTTTTISTRTRAGKVPSPTTTRTRPARSSTSTRTRPTSTTITATAEAVYSRDMARLGIVLAPFATLPAAEFVAVAREAEARGYHAAWTGEASGYDAITLMATTAGATERLHVGSAVLPVQTRTPVVLGQTAATLSHLAPGRAVLGIGLSSKVIVGDWHGLAFAPSLQQIREAVQIIRMVASGERVNFEGKFYRVKNFRLTAPPPAKPARVVLAALGPEMLELAGAIADGGVLNWIPPEAVPVSITHLQAGAKKAGRALGDFEIASFIRTCVTDDASAAQIGSASCRERV